MKKYEVIKLGEYDLAPDMCYVDYGGWVDVSSAEVFDRDIADYNELPEINKKALRNFIKSMDKKYGKGKHKYSIPIS